MNPTAKQMIMYEEKLPEYIEQIPFGTKFIYSFLLRNTRPLNQYPKNINIHSCGYLIFLPKKMIHPIKDEHKIKTNDLSTHSSYQSYSSTDGKIQMEIPNDSQFYLIDEYGQYIFYHDISLKHQKYVTIAKYQTNQIEKCNVDDVVQIFLYPLSEMDILLSRYWCQVVDYPNKVKSAHTLYIPVPKYRIKIYYLLNIKDNITFGYIYFVGKQYEFKMVNCVDKNIYVEESEYPLCNFKVGEFIELCNEKTGLLEIRFEISSKKLFFYEQEKIVGMKIISDDTYYFVKYF
jgi:hypothetical protein